MLLPQVSALSGMAPPDALELPLTPFAGPSWWLSLIDYPPIKALLPIPILLAIAPLVWWFFRGTWEEVDRQAAAERAARGSALDYRPAVCLAVTAVVLTIQEYYGGRGFFTDVIVPALRASEEGGAIWLKLDKYEQLYGFVWWVAARVIGYVIVPFTVWKLVFPQDSLLDMGLRTRGFLRHLWLYGLCLGIVLPVVLIVAHQPDFGTYYPFYKLSSRSWMDFLAWEGMYFVQFLALELFFRGFILGALRRAMGASAIFAMAVPYCMIHYGKPYLEAHGAIVAGVVLGSLAMRTKSIYAGFLVHISVAFSMDFLALLRRDALPTVLWPP